jgi:hypothetical protein
MADPETANPTPNSIERSSGELTQPFFGSQILENIYKIVDAGIIIPRPPVKGYPPPDHFNLDRDKALALLPTLHYVRDPDIYTKEQEAKERQSKISPEEIATLKVKSGRAFQRVVKDLVDNGVITRSLVVQAARLVKPNEVKVGAGGVSEFGYRNDYFPEINEEKASLNIDIESEQLYLKRLAGKLDNLGITLAPEQLEEVALAGLLSHEYGHALHKTIELLQIEQRLTELVERPAKDDLWEIGSEVKTEVLQTLTKIASDPQLDQISYFSNGDRRTAWPIGFHQIDAERLGTGFELLGLKYSLKRTGLSDDDVAKVVGSYLDEKTAIFNEFKTVEELIKSRGLRVSEVERALDSLAGMQGVSSSQDLQNRVPEMPAFLPGYYRPIPEAQIRQFISSFPD